VTESCERGKEEDSSFPYNVSNFCTEELLASLQIISSVELVS